MRSLASEAAVYRHLLLDGLIAPKQVVGWADEWIMASDDYPEALVDVSLSASRINDLSHALSELAASQISGSGIPLLFRHLATYLNAYPDDVSGVTWHLQRLTVEDQLPPHIGNEVAGLNEWLTLAAQGDLGSVDQEVEAAVTEVRRVVRGFAEQVDEDDPEIR